jgi:hypothetical protein
MDAFAWGSIVSSVISAVFDLVSHALAMHCFADRSEKPTERSGVRFSSQRWENAE